ncbi:hypothetical protein SAMN05421839_10582 [Halolactibacillus halophilus]|uniref:Uncharacterized protein n=1 Tax=Halolactibacillus halophilus TaxID=306540 RepID=A0A1I5MIH3_9BACI|nr:hypothetical protein [Halolactibacillus halophilus]GEM02976.1 hypothetical protein HHA03_25080 [Halolactibacillus halophilus]SFP08751.1 hypothetical protein SAMN05421839_10582 [Halolactibacillus halophilus]
MCEEEKVSLEDHASNIAKILSLKSLPEMMYGNEARNFVKKHFPKGYKESSSGAFLFDELPEIYRESGVVCVYDCSVGTLAHELCHAKQYEDNNKWLKMNLFNKRYRKCLYAFYPVEKEALEFAIKYLKDVNHHDYGNYKSEYCKTRIFWIVSSVTKTVVLFLFFYFLFVLFKNFF